MTGFFQVHCIISSKVLLSVDFIDQYITPEHSRDATCISYVWPTKSYIMQISC